MSKKLLTFESGMELQKLSKIQAKDFKSLSAKKEREKQGLFLAEGSKCVLDMLPAFDLYKLVATCSWIDAHPEIRDKFYGKILLTDHRGLEIMSSLTNVPDIIGIFRLPPQEEDPVYTGLDINHLYLLLDEIQDPGNLGTIIRTCDWFGVYDIFASKTTVDAYNPKVVQATMGSLSRVKIHYTDLEKLIDSNEKIRVLGTLLDGIPIDTVESSEGGFLLMGNEGRGISDNLKKRINMAITIPPKNKASHPDSLNVAIATAICLSKLT